MDISTCITFITNTIVIDGWISGWMDGWMNISACITFITNNIVLISDTFKLSLDDRIIDLLDTISDRRVS